LQASIYDHDAQKVVQVYKRLEADVDGGRERLETDANMVYDESVFVIREAIRKASLSPTQIASIGITVQRNAFTSCASLFLPNSHVL
jgi:glycerol kinase